jgi:hypothetical protein
MEYRTFRAAGSTAALRRRDGRAGPDLHRGRGAGQEEQDPEDQVAENYQC